MPRAPVLGRRPLYPVLVAASGGSLDFAPMQPETQTRIKDLSSTLSTIEKVMDLDVLRERARELEAQAGDPSLWDDPAHAQKVTTELSLSLIHI